MSWIETMASMSIRVMIIEKTFIPLLCFIGIWVLLSVTRAFLPKKYTVWMAIVGAFGFLIFPIDQIRGGPSLWSALINFQCVVCGVCGLGLSLFAFRLDTPRNYRGDLGGRFSILVIIAAILLFTTLGRVFSLF